MSKKQKSDTVLIQPRMSIAEQIRLIESFIGQLDPASAEQFKEVRKKLQTHPADLAAVKEGLYAAVLNALCVKALELYISTNRK